MIKSILNKIEKILPRYAWLPLVAAWGCNVLVFSGTRLYNRYFYHYDFTCAVDELIPFWQPAIIIYVLAFVQWFLCNILICRESRELCMRFIKAFLICEAVCFLTFTFLPTIVQRPEPAGGGVCSWIMRIVFGVDEPVNDLPSLHCIFSWLCFRGIRECENTKKSVNVLHFVFTLMVFASTMLVKQHVFADVVTGFIAAELAYRLAPFIKRRGSVRA